MWRTRSLRSRVDTARNQTMRLLGAAGPGPRRPECRASPFITPGAPARARAQERDPFPRNRERRAAQNLVPRHERATPERPSPRLKLTVRLSSDAPRNGRRQPCSDRARVDWRGGSCFGQWRADISARMGVGVRGAALRVWLFVSTYLAFWAVVAFLFWWLAPTWFVGSRVGLQTVLQVLPAVVVAVLVLILGSAAW
jgi:hypothetical protein